MAKESKNPAQFTEKEMDIIDQITHTLAIIFYSYVEDYRDPKKYFKHLLKICESDSGLALSTLFLNTKNIEANQSFFPNEINKKLATILASESESYLNSIDLSRKVLKELKNVGIFVNIRGKQKIKNQAPESLPRKKKTGEPRRQGFLSAYKLENEVERYKQILSNPEALEFINKRLLKIPGLLEKTYYHFTMNSFYAVMKGNERIDKFYAMCLNALVPDQQLSTADWQQYRQSLLSLNNNQLEDYAKSFAAHLMETPNAHLILVLSLPRMDFGQHN